MKKEAVSAVSALTFNIMTTLTPATLLLAIDMALRAPATWERLSRLCAGAGASADATEAPVMTEALGHIRRACDVVASRGRLTDDIYADVYVHLGRARTCLAQLFACARKKPMNGLLSTMDTVVYRSRDPASWQELSGACRELRRSLPMRPVTLEESVATSCCLDLADACAEADIVRAFNTGSYAHAQDYVRRARRTLEWYLHERETEAPAPVLREA